MFSITNGNERLLKMAKQPKKDKLAETYREYIAELKDKLRDLKDDNEQISASYVSLRSRLSEKEKEIADLEKRLVQQGDMMEVLRNDLKSVLNALGTVSNLASKNT
jgi:chromosome segregation ATPase